MARQTPTGTAPSRRDLLRAGGLGTSATVLASCDMFSTDPAGADGEGGTDQGPEAPQLAEAVEAGELPPVDERLPDEPMELDVNEIGRYGGELRQPGFDEAVDVNGTIGGENLLRYRPGLNTDLTEDQVIPNVASGFEVSDDGTEYTFTLRKGMKWSDGEPFTADDIMFWYESVAMNAELTTDAYEWLDTGDGRDSYEVEKVDDHTIVFRFNRPNGLFIVNLASQRGTAITDYPAHYMRQFHPDHVEDIDAVVEQSDSDNWVDLFQTHEDRAEDPERPVIDAWKLTSAVSENRRPVAERNPYYWKIDPAGSQLPYIDRVTFELVQEEQAAVLKTTNGEYDLVERNITNLRNKPVFARSRDEGGFDFFDTIPQNMNQMVIMVNMTHQDPVLREIFSNRDFRAGLSHAINRREIIDSVFQRQGEPWQAAPRPESPYHNEELATQHTEFDLDLANEYLDRVLPESDRDGMRLRPDGAPLRFQIESPDHEPDFVDALDLVSTQWREVGINMNVHNIESSHFGERMEGNLHDGAVWEGAGGLGATMDPFYWVPYNFNTRYAMPWYFWLLNPEDERAEEPPPETMRQIELYQEMMTTADTDERDQLMHQLLENAIELFYSIGIALRMREYAVASTSLRNVPDLSATGWLHGALTPSNPQQYFYAGE